MLKRLSGEQWIALGVIFIGLMMAWQITGITKTTGYAGVGPRFFPSLIVIGLILAGGLLFWQSRPSHQAKLALTATETPPSDSPIESVNWRSFGLVSASLLAHMSLIGYVGFTLAGTLLCFGICLALETKRPIIDLVLSFLLSFGLFHLFKWLGLNLPSLIFGGII